MHALCDPFPHLKKMHNLRLRAAMRIGQSIHSFIQSLTHSPHVPCASTTCQTIFQGLRIEMPALTAGPVSTAAAATLAPASVSAPPAGWASNASTAGAASGEWEVVSEVEAKGRSRRPQAGGGCPTESGDRKSTRLNSSHKHRSRMPSSA